MMKKFACLLLAMLLLVCLCGCVPNTGNLRGEIETPSSSTNTPDNNETPPPSTGPELSLGKTENNRYHNDYFGLSCTLPSNWIFYTDEEIRELNNIAMGALEEDISDLLKNATVIHDMFAKNSNGFCSTNTTMEKLSALQVLTLDLKKNIEIALPALEQSYANMGYTNIQTAYTKITVNGKEYDGMTLTCQLQGINFYAASICYIKNSYLVSINVGSLITNETETLLSYYTLS